MGTVHSILSKERAEALDLVTWVFAVAKLPADSPRFNYYVSRWDVPNKIRRFKADGTFDKRVENCPPIDPAWLRFAPAAFEEHRRYCAEFGIAMEPPLADEMSQSDAPMSNSRRLSSNQ